MLTDEERELMHSIRQMLESEAWRKLEELAQSQIALREAQVMSGIEASMDGAFQMQQLRGERMGIKLFLTLPEGLLRELEDNDDVEEEDEVV